MFKNIGDAFEGKKNNLISYKNKDQDIKQNLKIFLEKEFGETLKGFSFVITYNPKDNSLNIGAENKILANELTLKLSYLSEFLSKQGIKLSKILVR